MKKNYDLSALMSLAWGIFRNKANKCETFAEALKRAWACFDCGDDNRKAIEDAKSALNITENVRTWYGHYTNGMMVKHGESALFQVRLATPEKGIGKTYLTSFFGDSQIDTIENVLASEAV